MIDDIINASWAFQDMVQIGRKEGIKEGLEEGLEKGLRAQRQSLILLIQKHYPALLQLTQDVCNAIQTLDELQDLFQKVLLAKDEQEAHQLLLDAK